jgi:squalene synthase HpnC
MGPQVQPRADAPSAASDFAISEAAMSELARIADGCSAKITGENFPVALRVLPAEARDHLRRAYVFARFVDDVGDRAAGDRLALLDLIDEDIAQLTGGRPALGPVRELAPLVDTRGLELQPLRDLVEANRRDQRVSRYRTFDELLDYCRLSAAPVGRIVLAIAGVDDPAAVAESDQVCAALQVLEHCQDVGEDAAAGRIYLPAGDLAAFRVVDADLAAPVTSPGLRRVIALETARAGQLLDAGRPLVRRLHGWARIAVLGYVAGGRATAAALRRADFDVLGRQVQPGRPGTLRQAALLAVGR